MFGDPVLRQSEGQHKLRCDKIIAHCDFFIIKIVVVHTFYLGDNFAIIQNWIIFGTMRA